MVYRISTRSGGGVASFFFSSFLFNSLVRSIFFSKLIFANITRVVLRLRVLRGVYFLYIIRVVVYKI